MNRFKALKRSSGVATMLLVAATAQSATPALNAVQQRARDIYQQLVEINTTESVGDTFAAAQAMAAACRWLTFKCCKVRPSAAIS
jgi:hypothetical protein